MAAAFAVQSTAPTAPATKSEPLKCMETVERLDRAIRRGEYAAAATIGEELKRNLAEESGKLTPEQARRIGYVSLNGAEVAKAENQWGFWDVMGAIFTLSFTAWYDLATTNDHERMQNVFDTYADNDSFAKVGTQTKGTDAKWLKAFFHPSEAKVISQIAKELLDMDPDNAADEASSTGVAQMTPSDRAQVLQHIAEASAGSQEIFLKKMFNGTTINSDDARFLLQFDPDAVAAAMTPDLLHNLDESAKDLLVRHIVRCDDEDMLHSFLYKILSGDGAKVRAADILGTDGRAAVIENLLDGTTSEKDSTYIVALIAGLPVTGNADEPKVYTQGLPINRVTASKVFAHMSLDRVAQIESDVEGDRNVAKLKEAAQQSLGVFEDAGDKDSESTLETKLRRANLI
jgi:hypothetical protein